MSWSLIKYEYFLDKDEYSIINIKIKDVNIDDDTDNRYLDDTKTYLNDLRKSYKTKSSLTRQIKVDFPRILCYINNIKIKSIKDFIREIRHTSFKNEAAMICTQSSAFPVTLRLIEEFRDEKKNIHVTDYYSKNKLVFHFKIFDKNHIHVNIEKKFAIKQIKNGVPYVLKILKTNTLIELNNNTSDNKDVFYTITEVKNDI